MSKNCSGCQYGSYDPMSDVCDGCRSDPDTGWGGFTDHMIGKHFNSEEERSDYERQDSNADSDLAGD